MKTVTIRDMRSRPREVQQALAEGSDALLTSNGRPVAVMIPVAADSMEETLDVLRRARALQTVAKMRQRATEQGRDRLTMREIDAEIQTVRGQRRDFRKKNGPRMIDAVLDTNVVVSGLLSQIGAPGRIIDLALNGELRPVFSDSILAEYRVVLGPAEVRAGRHGSHGVDRAYRMDGAVGRARPVARRAAGPG